MGFVQYPRRQAARPHCASSSPSAFANAASSFSLRASDQPSVSKASRGRAPLAIRSETFTRTSFRAIVSIGSEGMKCTPSTSASTVATRTPPSVSSTATSSRKTACAFACCKRRKVSGDPVKLRHHRGLELGRTRVKRASTVLVHASFPASQDRDRASCTFLSGTDIVANENNSQLCTGTQTK